MKNMIDYTKYNDEELLPLLKGAKPYCDFAFYELYQRYSKKLNAYCRFNISDIHQSDEIFQETWIRFDKSVKEGISITNVLSYMISISKNLIIYKSNIDKFRNKFVVKVDNEVFEDFSQYFNFQDAVENNQLSEILKTAVNCLDDIYKEAFILRKFEDLSYSEISAITGETVPNIKKRVTRATIKIKEILKPYISELN